MPAESTIRRNPVGKGQVVLFRTRTWSSPKRDSQEDKEEQQTAMQAMLKFPKSFLRASQTSAERGTLRLKASP